MSKEKNTYVTPPQIRVIELADTSSLCSASKTVGVQNLTEDEEYVW